MLHVYEEIDEIMSKQRVGMFKIKDCHRKYAFEKTEIPRETDYMKLMYPYDSEFPAFSPVNANKFQNQPCLWIFKAKPFHTSLARTRHSLNNLSCGRISKALVGSRSMQRNLRHYQTLHGVSSNYKWDHPRPLLLFRTLTISMLHRLHS